ncbi:MAG: hypothetical protein Q4B95_08150 [Lonepinella koalarum]|nr:hypothetical protein [Lonepinella koalarum]
MAEKMMTKRQLEAHIRKMIFAELKPLGFAKKESQFIIENDIFIFKILAAYTSGKDPNGLIFEFTCALTIKSINEFLNSLDNREFTLATFLFPLEILQSPDANGLWYKFYLDNEKDTLEKIQKITHLIKNIIKHFDKIQGVEILTEKGIRKLPFLFKRYRNGLMADFKYCQPPVAVIGQALDGNIDTALEFLNKGHILSDIEKAKLKELIETKQLNAIFNFNPPPKSDLSHPQSRQ